MLGWWTPIWNLPTRTPARVQWERCRLWRGLGDSCGGGVGRTPGGAPGLTGKSRGAGAKREPAPARWPGWDAAGRDFQQPSEPAKQTLAKSSLVV